MAARARRLAALAFGLAAVAFSALVVVGFRALGSGGGTAPWWGFVLVPAAFALVGSTAGALAGPRFGMLSRTRYAVLLGMLVTVGAAMLYTMGVFVVGILFGAVDPSELASLPIAVGLALVGSIPAMPIGALAGWWVHGRLRPDHSGERSPGQHREEAAQTEPTR